jgi:hypothetical protein
LRKKGRAGGDGGTTDARGTSGTVSSTAVGDQDLVSSLDAAAILRMKQHPSSTQKVNLSEFRLIKRSIGTPTRPPRRMIKAEGSCRPADATKSNLKLGHRRTSIVADEVRRGRERLNEQDCMSKRCRIGVVSRLRACLQVAESQALAAAGTRTERPRSFSTPSASRRTAISRVMTKRAHGRFSTSPTT